MSHSSINFVIGPANSQSNHELLDNGNLCNVPIPTKINFNLVVLKYIEAQFYFNPSNFKVSLKRSSPLGKSVYMIMRGREKPKVCRHLCSNFRTKLAPCSNQEVLEFASSLIETFQLKLMN